MDNTPNGELALKVCISQLIIIQIQKCVLSIYTIRDRLSQKTISRYYPFKRPPRRQLDCEEKRKG
jgi:hypothetical protein